MTKLFAPVDSASLVFFRIAFGFLMLIEVWRYLDKGWINRYFIAPDYWFHYTGFGWVRPWEGDGMVIHFYVMGVFALGIMLGFCYRLCAIGFFFAFTYVFLLEKANYLNHFYLISLVSFLLIWVSPHRALSLDARLRPSIASDTVPAWMRILLVAQLGIVYFYAGIAKISRDWLSGRPLDKWLAAEDDFPLIGPLFELDVTPLFFAWSGFLLDLLAAPLLLWRRTRMIMFVFLVMFHLTNVRLFDIGIFPWLAIGMTTLFFDPSWPRRIFNWPSAGSVDGSTVNVSRRRQWLIAAGFCGYLAAQALFPLRHHLYPGNVAWTEEGHNFSWRMKLRSKRGTVRFRLHNPDTGMSWHANIEKYLSDRQERKMASRPLMIHHFAKYLAERAREEGHERVEVYVRSRASLNGRKLQTLIDPSVDLAAEPIRWLRADPWLVPLEAEEQEIGEATEAPPTGVLPVPKPRR